MKRTGYCGEFRAQHVGERVTVFGWVARARNLGGLIFVDLRDRSGIVQCVFDESGGDKALFDRAAELRSEYTVKIEGVMRERGSKNPNIPTGEVEILADALTLFSKADTTPFEIVENCNTNDLLLLKYRYLDLRRPDISRFIQARHRITHTSRNYFHSQGFLEIETPILTKSTPEGARDYLVPSRVHPGKFYALPQSPQQYKQLLMLAGFDRYMQITRCFRDEDLRADRQPEFTQIDLEMSFVDVEDVLEINEGFLVYLFKEVLNIDLPLPLPRLTYTEAMDRFGSDKPDIRFGFELCDISPLLANTGFKVFADALAKGGSVRGINIKGGGKLPRKEVDALGEFVKTYRAKGLAWYKSANGEVSSSFAKFMEKSELDRMLNHVGFEDNDLLCIVADKNDVVFDALGALRLEAARKMNIIPKGVFKPLWVTDFPLFEYSEEDGRYYAKHHPFTAPRDEDLDKLESDPGSVCAKAYDIVINGYEVGGGSIRIHQSDMQKRMFAALGFTPEAVEAQFGHLTEAFRYGAPPHGGLAFGLDRLCMLLCGTDDIRDVIAFPKLQNASEPMMASPSEVEKKQLDELCIAIKTPEA